MEIQEHSETEADLNREKIYVCSPYRAVSDSEEEREMERERNDERVLKACRLLALIGYMPLASHAFFPQFLLDDDPHERKIGMDLGLELLSLCDELWVFGDTISDGMRAEIDFAEKSGIPVHYMPEPDDWAKLMHIQPEYGCEFYFF